MEEQLITFETARLAKEKGFTLNVVGSHKYNYFTESGELGVTSWGHLHLDEPAEVPQSLLQKWLREKHGIHIVLIPTINAAWTYKTTTVLSERDEEVIIGIKDVGDLPPYKNVCGEDFSTYEKALERGLQEALKLIP